MNTFLENNRSWLRVVLILVYLFIILVPGYIFFQQRGGFIAFHSSNPKTFASLIFPLFGLYAFTLIWLQTIIGMNMFSFSRVFGRVLSFHRAQGLFALLFATTHAAAVPYIYGLSQYIGFKFLNQEYRIFALYGTIAFFFLILAVAAGLFRRARILRPFWRYIHLLNYVTFVLIFIHSRNLGADVIGTILEPMWNFFALTFAVSLAFRLRRYWAERQVKQTQPL